ncbi:hypothetical protein BLNAU_3658 [Blattamonas nauphoetae]|uniref:Uncharacterized protein n=1 Tax=Blattamonas nauphoetae TaxID=2049346 RepID=A0ABQ9YBR6_9EUKA|nr:hypothetical protein BLNAU_3658 [Blattamonas nauphoetae]
MVMPMYLYTGTVILKYLEPNTKVLYECTVELLKKFLNIYTREPNTDDKILLLPLHDHTAPQRGGVRTSNLTCSKALPKLYHAPFPPSRSPHPARAAAFTIF